MDFGQRFGFKSVKEILLIDTITEELRNRIWSEIYSRCFQHYVNDLSEWKSNEKMLEMVRANFCKFPLDELQNRYIQSNRTRNINRVKDYIFGSPEWFKPYVFMEYILNNVIHESDIVALENIFNTILKQEGSAYTLINKQLIQITSEQEIQSIEEALESTDLYSGVQQHLNRALQLMSDRQNPNYSKSMHESISAVEGLAQALLNKDSITLGDATAELHKKYGLNTILMGSLSKLYGYTSRENGVRHGSNQESNLGYIDAKFILVACTNFINYLIDKTKDQNLNPIT